jgi:general secretion pathway protein B
MSYILDALKKAEAQRETGTVPGLGSSQGSHSTYISYTSNARPWWLVALVLGVLLLLVLALWVWRQPPPVGAPLPVAAVVAPMPAVAPVPVAAPVVPVASTPLPPDVHIKPPQTTLFRPVAEPLAAVVPPTPAPVPLPTAAKPVPAPSAPVGNPPRTTAGIPLLQDLPDGLRRQIPPLAISGAIYSDAPSEWTLIVNDQVLGRGSQVTPEVRLEEISATSAVFNFRGQRFRIDH